MAWIGDIQRSQRDSRRPVGVSIGVQQRREGVLPGCAGGKHIACLEAAPRIDEPVEAPITPPSMEGAMAVSVIHAGHRDHARQHAASIGRFAIDGRWLAGGLANQGYICVRGGFLGIV
ncbi:hypothetical protein MXAZACID_14648 [Acidocella sp. MX-AZ02]|nr:hypothetical protein MXAZACID_14648 [Acidocella sp. MX-AZ02]